MAFLFMCSLATVFPGHVSNGCRLSHFPISSQPSSSSFFPDFNGKILIINNRTRQFSLRATYQPPVQAPSVTYAREMERVSAKESLLLAIKDAGGFSSLVSGNTTDLMRIDVNERIIDLERLNPTSRPTTSSLLEGRWNFEWFGSSSTGSFHARLVLE
ncbi:probable plastid-lipid-associated protein 13, chloroplastic [Impatiens glandulifera]|uniref:probable plastid-lipid-associated protein 13, chloroplastic n=1 Tax=Impatiens glandulifera TaxID=253017 RepID=UPI001FB081EB|nr:probable plastid-lipid-associated protein 13, chloroplastic [Impatiens glandulifera]